MDFDIIDILEDAKERNASDIFIIANRNVSYSINGEIVPSEKFGKLMRDTTAILISQIYANTANMSSNIPARSTDIFDSTGNDDFSLTIPGVARFRVNAYIQRGSKAAVIRVIQFELPDPEKIGIPERVLSLADTQKGGLIIITGTAGSGKSTTLATIIDRINSTQNKHIITLEDPIEYLHRHNKSIVSQREIGTDVPDYLSALRAALRQKPDVILLGEMRDYETISVALTAAETGHLVFSSLHTMGAANSIERMIDVFPANQQDQIRYQLSMSLKTVVSQELIPAKNGGLVPIFEIMNVNPAISNLIRTGNIKQIDNTISTSSSENMISLSKYADNLYHSGIISEDTKKIYCPGR